jgi:ABC-type phosphate transport system substrate-binding protein
MASSNELVVIVHPDSPLQKVAANQISDLYLGRTRSLAPGVAVEAFDQAFSSENRKRFYQQINGMPIRQVNAYWARLQFSGSVQPPLQVADCQAVINAVRQNPKAIGYVESRQLTADVRVLLRLKD